MVLLGLPSTKKMECYWQKIRSASSLFLPSNDVEVKWYVDSFFEYWVKQILRDLIGFPCAKFPAPVQAKNGNPLTSSSRRARVRSLSCFSGEPLNRSGLVTKDDPEKAQTRSFCTKNKDPS